MRLAETATNIFRDYAGIWAMIGTIFSGVGLAFANKFVNKNKESTDIAVQLRSELRNENTELKEDNRLLYNENEDLRNKIIELQRKVSGLEEKVLRLENELNHVRGNTPDN